MGVFHLVVEGGRKTLAQLSQEEIDNLERDTQMDADWHRKAVNLLESPVPFPRERIMPDEDVECLRRAVGDSIDDFRANELSVRMTTLSGLQLYAERGIALSLS